ncbi:MAG: hypothetical protein OER95_14015 [Acidimicrobiia bacterium]|nr:hypothetical protein [Acidimicrobiia bacterium]
MNSFPTTSDLAGLGVHIAEDGFGPHERAVAEFVALGRDIEPDLPSLQILADTGAPGPVRARALARVGYRWDGIHRQLVERQQEFEQSLTEMLDVATNSGV